MSAHKAVMQLEHLPNELLLHILSNLKTVELLPILSTCRKICSISIRLLHSRMLSAANTLAGFTLFLECYPPSASLTADGFFCSRSNDESPDLSQTDLSQQLHSLKTAYTRFTPRRTEPVPVSRRPGDIPGSRTFDADKISEMITVEASDLFTQLTTRAYLGKREPRRGYLVTMHLLIEGTIRVWRDWLSKQCESRSFPDGSVIALSEESTDESVDAPVDPRILWVNKGNDCLGIRLKVKSRSRQGALPIIYTSEVELPVSYRIEFEEVSLRTSHLLLKLEEAREQSINGHERAIVFGSIQQTS